MKPRLAIVMTDDERVQIARALEDRREKLERLTEAASEYALRFKESLEIINAMIEKWFKC